MTVHKHAAMIKAKADNMELVVFQKTAFGEWVLSAQDALPCFENVEYFLCHEQNTNACLHLLNGGDVEFSCDGYDWMDSCKNGKSLVWDESLDIMSEDYYFRIKPRKEKRWVAVNVSDGDACLCTEHSMPAPGYQIIEIEVEV